MRGAIQVRGECLPLFFVEIGRLSLANVSANGLEGCAGRGVPGGEPNKICSLDPTFGNLHGTYCLKNEESWKRKCRKCLLRADILAKNKAKMYLVES